MNGFDESDVGKIKDGNIFKSKDNVCTLNQYYFVHAVCLCLDLKNNNVLDGTALIIYKQSASSTQNYLLSPCI